MKHLGKTTFFAVLMLCSAAQANVVESMVRDTVDTSAYYVEHLCRITAILAAGGAVQKHLPATRQVEELLSFLDKLPYVKEYGLRTQGAKVVWGAALIAAVRQLAKQGEVHRSLREAPALNRLIDWLLDFQPHHAHKDSSR